MQRKNTFIIKFFRLHTIISYPCLFCIYLVQFLFYILNDYIYITFTYTVHLQSVGLPYFNNIGGDIYQTQTQNNSRKKFTIAFQKDALIFFPVSWEKKHSLLNKISLAQNIYVKTSIVWILFLNLIVIFFVCNWL